MSYMQVVELIKRGGYKDIKCMWYWNPMYIFSRGLRPLKCDNDVLQLTKDANVFELIYVYIEYNINQKELMTNYVGNVFPRIQLVLQKNKRSA